jgi:hypothetical protein
MRHSFQRSVYDRSPTKEQLSPGRLWLLRQMQSLNYGRLEGIYFRGGEPVSHPAPRIIRHYKFGADNGPRPEINRGNYQLKHQVLELFAILQSRQNGVIDVLHVRAGLPCEMTVVEGTC